MIQCLKYRVGIIKGNFHQKLNHKCCQYYILRLYLRCKQGGKNYLGKIQNLSSVERKQWPKSVMAISVLLTAISICSRQFQLAHGNFNFTHGNFNLLTAISICSWQFQFAHGNFNLPTAISICSRQFQFTHGNFNLLTAILITAISILHTAISIYSRQFHNFTQGNFNFFKATLTPFFPSLTTCQLRRPRVATHQKSKRKIKSGQLKSIFKEKSENHNQRSNQVTNQQNWGVFT